MEGQVVQGGTKENTVEVKKYKDLKVYLDFNLGKNKETQIRARETHRASEQSLIATGKYYIKLQNRSIIKCST